jgi:hypothetical protein
VVIFGIITHNLFRSMAVYSFVSFPGWPFPFAKPRFVVEKDRLSLLNVPLPSPQAILTARAITDLPFVDYDRGYRAEEWAAPARPVLSLPLSRVRASRRWGPDAKGSDARVMASTAEILRAFIRDVRADGRFPSSCSVVALTSAFGPGNRRGKASPRRCCGSPASRTRISRRAWPASTRPSASARSLRARQERRGLALCLSDDAGRCPRE